MDNLSSIIIEHRVWLQILGDHARFAIRSLAPTEHLTIKRAESLMVEFDGLLTRARQDLPPSEIDSFNRKAYQVTITMKNYQLAILRQQLTNNIAINMPPIFLNHMINELEEYEGKLKYWLTNQNPPEQHIIHYHMIWLLDAEGHAAAIASSLDETEKEYIAISLLFKKQFRDLYAKASEISGFLRSNLLSFPALERLNIQSEQLMLKFMNFLQEIDQLQVSKQLLGALNPLFPDHMLREECYYLHKLATLSQVNAPKCDPTKPRVVEKP